MVAPLSLLLLLQQPAPQMHYDVSVRVEPAERTMYAQVEMTIPVGALTADQINIRLAKGMSVPTILVDGERAEPARFVEETANNLWIFPASKEREHKVSLTYRSIEREGRVFFLGERASFVSGVNRKWYPSTFDDTISATLTVDVPKGDVVRATGRLADVSEGPDRVAYRFDVAKTLSLSFVVGPYSIHRDASGRWPVSLYLLSEREWSSKAVAALRETADALVDWFGPYPFDEMCVVEVEPDSAEVSGFVGASLEGILLVTPEFLQGGPNLALSAHELSHGWWAHQLKRTGSAGVQIMDEAMAQFGSLKAVEAVEGDAKAREYRTTGYPGYLLYQSGQGSLRMMTRDYDPPLGHLPGNRDSHDFADGKGFLVFHQLEQVVGTDRLKRAFRAIQRSNAWKRITFEDFLSHIEACVGFDLKWFYDQWFERGGAPKWTVTWAHEGGRLAVTVEQASPPFRFVTDLDIHFADGTKRRVRVEVMGERTRLEWQVEGEVSKVVLDPEWHVFHWDPELVDIPPVAVWF